MKKDRFGCYGIVTRAYNCLVALGCDMSTEAAARASAIEVLKNGRFRNTLNIGLKTVRDLVAWVDAGGGILKTCEGCQFWVKREFDIGDGHCRRRAPRAELMREDEEDCDYFAQWPITLARDWCGEWKTELQSIEAR